jgi:hypothetical protein
MTPDSAGLTLIGWKEYLDLPDWGIRRVPAKIDTGAYTSVLDVAGCKIRPGGPTGQQAEFALVLHRGHSQHTLLAPIVRFALVRSSNGDSEERPVVDVLIRLGPVQTHVQFTLTRRSGMRHRILLGRRALAGTFAVDVSRRYLLRRKKGSS